MFGEFLIVLGFAILATAHLWIPFFIDEVRAKRGKQRFFYN